jgi:hypothetical protein
MYNQKEDRFFCLTEASNKDAVQKHHSKHGFGCEWITEVKTTAKIIVILAKSHLYPGDIADTVLGYLYQSEEDQPRSLF